MDLNSFALSRKYTNIQFDKTIIDPHTQQVKELDTRSDYPNDITILVGNKNEPAPSTTSANVRFDREYWWRNERGYRVTPTGESTQVRWDFSPDIEFDEPCVIGAWVYIPEPDKIGNIGFDIYKSTEASSWAFTITDHDWVAGWNLIRIGSHNGVTEDLNHAWRVRLRVIFSELDTWVTLGCIFSESTEKARLIFTQDGGSKDFFDNYAGDLISRDIPITLGLQVGKVGTEGYMTLEEIETLAETRNVYVNFHSWGETITAGMSDYELISETKRCIQWLKKHGFDAYPMYRTAWWQNNAPAHKATQFMLDVYASPLQRAGNITAFPWTNPHDIVRLALHNITSEQQDGYFQTMKNARSTMMAYTHLVTPAGGSNDMSDAEWDNFLNNIDTGVSEGWLEGTSIPELHNGKTYREIMEQLAIATRN